MVSITFNIYNKCLGIYIYIYSGVGSGVAPGARALPCWIGLESFHKQKTCFAGRIFRVWNGGPSLVEPPCRIERACLHEATAELADKQFNCLTFL